MDIYGAKRAPVSEKISTNFLNESFYMSSTVQTNANPVSHFDKLESLLKTNGHVKSSNTITSVDFFEVPEDTISQKKSPENILIPELEISYDEYDEDDDDDEDDNGQFSMNMLNIQPLKERMQRKGSKVHIMNRSFSHPRSKEPLYATNASENSDHVSAAHGSNNATAVKSLSKSQENSALNQSFYSDFVKMNASSDSADVHNNNNNNNNINNNNYTGNNNNETNINTAINNTANNNINTTTATITPINISQPPASTKSVLSSPTGPNSTGKSLQKKKSVSLMLPERDRDIWGNCAVASGNLPVIYSNNTDFIETAQVAKPMVDTNIVPNNTNINISKSPVQPVETTPGTAVSTQPKTMARTLSRILSEMSMDGDVADDCDDSSDDDSQSFAEVNRKLNSFKRHRNSNNNNNNINTNINNADNNNNNTDNNTANTININTNNTNNNTNNYNTSNDITMLSVATVGSKSNDDGDFCDDFDAVPVRSLVRRTSASFYDSSPTNKLKHVNSFSSNSSNNTGNTGNNSGNNSNNSGMHSNITFNSENIGFINISMAENTTVVVLPATHKQPQAALTQYQTPQQVQQEPLQNTTTTTSVIAKPQLSAYKESYENIHFGMVFENSKCDTVENHVNPMFVGRNSNRNSLSSHSVNTAVSNNTKNSHNSNKSNNSNINSNNSIKSNNINNNSNNNNSNNSNNNSANRNIPAVVTNSNHNNDTNIESEIDLILTRTQSSIEQSIQQSRLSMRGLSNNNDNNNSSKRAYHIDTAFGDENNLADGSDNNANYSGKNSNQHFELNDSRVHNFVSNNTSIAQNLTLLQPQSLLENNHQFQQHYSQQQQQQQQEQFAVRNAMQFSAQINSPSHTKYNTITTPHTTTPNNVTSNNVTPNSGLKRSSTQYQIIRQKPDIQNNNHSNNSKSMNNLYASPQQLQQQYTPTRSVLLRPGEYADHNRPRDHIRPPSAATTPITAVASGVTLHTFLDMGLSRDEAQQLFNEHLAVLRNSNHNNHNNNSSNTSNNNNNNNQSNSHNNCHISSNNNTPVNSINTTNINISSPANSNTNHTNSYYKNNNDNVVRSRAGLSPFNRSHSTPVMTSPAVVVTPYLTTPTVSPRNSMQLKSSLKTSPKSSPKHGSNSGPMTPYFGPNFGGNVGCPSEDNEDVQRAILLSQQEALYGHNSSNNTASGGLVRTNSVRFA